MIKKVWKSFFYSFTFFFSIFLLLVVFVNYKLKDEAKSYLMTVDKVNQLNDTYILCLGLSAQNPSIENKNLCKSIKEELRKNYTLLEKEYPYMNFYNAFVKN